MPLVTGETLRARLDREKQLPIDDALLIAREVADALHYAHGLGVIHRDIKPENILLQGGHALVADFGIALAVQSAGGQRMTQTGLSLGTPQYMSPEQALGERTIDARSDIYALGAVTYEMLVGEAPFTGHSVQAIVARVLSEEPRGLSIQRKAIGAGVEDTVLRALEKLPADRFSTAAEFAIALDTRGTQSTRATRATRAMPAAKKAHGVTVIAAGVAVAATALAAWAFMRPRAEQDTVRYRVVLDFLPGIRPWTGEVAISPDGELIIHTGGPNGALLMRHRNELTFTPLPGTDNAIGPFFSTDGSQIGYFEDSRLMAAPVAGGPPVKLADSLTNPESATWSGDGYINRFIRNGNVIAVARMKAVPGSPLEKITTVDTAAGELAHFLPDILPDNKTLLFQVQYADGRRAIAVADVNTGKHTVLMTGVRAKYAANGYMLYTTSDGKLWAVPFDVSARTPNGTATMLADRIPSTSVGPIDFAVSTSGTVVYAEDDATAERELVWVARDGKRDAFDASWKGQFVSPAISPDGTRLAVTVRDNVATDIWVKNIGAGSPFRLTGDSKGNDDPVWSRDGRTVTFIAGVGGTAATGDLWSQVADGSTKPVNMLHLDRPLSEHTVSPDGGWMLGRTTTPTRGSGDIVGIRPGVDTTVVPIVATSNTEYSPSFSPGGKWLAYSSNETGRFEVYVAPFPNPDGVKWLMSSKGGTAPRWARRGGEIFYLDLDTRFMVVPVRTVPGFAVQNSRTLFNAANFVHVAISRRNYDIAPDDQRFLFVQRANGMTSGNVIVVENWFREMRERPQ